MRKNTVTAVVTWYNKAKRYGEAEDNHGKVFFLRQKDIIEPKNGTLLAGDRVNFRPSVEEVFELPVAEEIVRQDVSSEQFTSKFRAEQMNT